MIGRSFVKSLTYRLLATSCTMAIAWIMTGTLELAIYLGITEFLAKILIYTAHEQLWERIPEKQRCSPLISEMKTVSETIHRNKGFPNA